MVGRDPVQEDIIDNGIIAILRGVDEDQIVPVAHAISQGGITTIEITADTTRCSRLIEALDREFHGTDVSIGAGTVLDSATARNVIEAGADFVLTPTINKEVLEVCNRSGIVSIPGVMTPTEATHALEAGADMLKMFPASTVGPGHVSALQGPLADVPIVPTGGVSQENASDYFDAGAAAVGVGSALVDSEAIDNGDMNAISDNASQFKKIVEDARTK